MGVVKEQKCLNCGAAMRFEPKSGMLVCDYCGTEIQINITLPPNYDKQSLDGFDFHAFQNGAEDENAAALPVYICNSCGAELIAPAEEFSLTCPYCGNAIVLTDKISGKLRPDGVIPFSITPDVLPKAMKRFYRDKLLLPLDFFSKSRMEKITGVYVPFWVFSGTASGRLSFRGERTKPNKRLGDYIYTDTDVYIVERDVSVGFENVPVDASGKIDDALMDSLEPFDMDGVKPFDIGYLAGFTADRFDVPADDIAQRAEKRVCNTATDAAKRAISGYSGLNWINGRMKADMDAKYLLMPVYLFSLTYEGKSYSFAVNGQTGKVVGNIPIDKKVSLLFRILAAVLVFGGLLLLRFLLFLWMK